MLSPASRRPSANRPASWRNRVLLAAALVALVTAPLALAQTVVHPGDFQGWVIGPFGTAPTAGFVTGPATPPFGDGSYQTAITVPGSKQILARIDYHDVPLASLGALSYWTYIDPASMNVNNWYVNLYLDADGNGVSDVRLDYIPPSGLVSTGVWQQWDALAGTWDVSTGGTTTIANFLAANPNARINAFNDPNGGAIRFNMGDTAASYVGFDGNLDGVRIAVVGGADTTWDFELAPPPSLLEVPALSPAGLAALALLLLAAGAWVMRRRSTTGASAGA